MSAEELVKTIRERWGSRYAYTENSGSTVAVEHLILLSTMLGGGTYEAERLLLDGWVDPFEDGAQYWVTYKDGSRVLMTASIDSHGAVDLTHEEFDFSLWQVNVGDWDGYTFEKVA